MNANPVILDSLDNHGRSLARIEVPAKDAKDELWLQELLYRHPELLPVDELGETFSPLIPVGRECACIDDLFISPSGLLTIVETKLWKNPEKHRTVVAQIIDYAREVATWDYDRLCQVVRECSRARGETTCLELEDKVAQHLQRAGIALAEFQEAVVKNLAAGNFLLLIVGDKVSPNIALLSKAIHSAPGLGFTLGLIEMRLYPMTPGHDWPVLVVPDIVGRSVEKTRGVVKVLYKQGQEKPKIAVDVEAEETDGESNASALDLDVFLSQVPADLALQRT